MSTKQQLAIFLFGALLMGLSVWISEYDDQKWIAAAIGSVGVTMMWIPRWLNADREDR